MDQASRWRPHFLSLDTGEQKVPLRPTSCALVVTLVTGSGQGRWGHPSQGRWRWVSFASPAGNPGRVVAGPSNYPMILMQRLRVEGFIVLDYADRYPEAIAALGQWMAEGKIKMRTEIVDGLENALQTVKKLYKGANTGKLMIRVHES